MTKWTLIGLGLMLSLLANSIAPLFITHPPDSVNLASPQSGAFTALEVKKLTDPTQVANYFYQGLLAGNYQKVYQLMHPQVQAEVSQEQYVQELQAALPKAKIVLTGYKLGDAKIYQTWRSSFDPKARTYKNVQEIDVVLSGKERDNALNIPGVLILAPLPDGSWRVLRQ
ncbi:MAG: hypothetical protein WA118_13975 [Carboxydocellales bacterium]